MIPSSIEALRAQFAAEAARATTDADLRALRDRYLGRRAGLVTALLRAVADINRERAAHFVGKMVKTLDPIEDKVIAVLGLAFKPNTDDMREAKSVEVITRLLDLGARVRAYDPVAIPNARRLLPPTVTYCESPYEAAEGADALALVTEWNEFKFLNLERVRVLLRRPVVFDGRNVWEPERMRRLGFEYHSIGRRPVVSA